MFGREATGLDLMRTTSREIGAALDRVGMAWSYDNDGDVRFRTRSGQQPWIDPVFYEFDSTSTNFRMHGRFLKGRAIPQGNGEIKWEVPLDQGYRPTAIAQKVVTVYFIPRAGGVRLQIHAAVAPLSQARPMHIRIIPGSAQVARIERKYPRFVATEQTGPDGTKQFWMSGAVAGRQIDDAELLDLIRTLSSLGLEMFEGPFTGWMNVNGI